MLLDKVGKEFPHGLLEVQTMGNVFLSPEVVCIVLRVREEYRPVISNRQIFLSPCLIQGLHVRLNPHRLCAGDEPSFFYEALRADSSFAIRFRHISSSPCRSGSLDKSRSSP